MYANLSIRRFLLFNLVITIIAAIIITALGNYYIDKKAINKSLDSSLVEMGLLIRAIIHASDLAVPFKLRNVQSPLNVLPFLHKKDMHEAKLKIDEIKEEINPYKFQLWSSKKKLLFNSPQTPIVSLIAKPGLSNKIIDGNNWRIFTIYDQKAGLIIAIGKQYKPRYTMIRHMLINNTRLTLLIYPISGLFIWLIILSSLKNIGFFAKELTERAADHLEPVDFNKVPIEIRPLADELNKLFLRLQQAFEREQRFAADAAHELHTPLAALKTQTQLALKSTSTEECAIHLKEVLASVDRCTHVIQQLLTMCRLSPETILPEHFSWLNLAHIATEVVAQLAPQAILKQIEIELIATEPEYKLLGNATGLHVLIRNLVDNAIRYTPSGGMVKVVLLNFPQAIHLNVIDNGPGIPEKLRARVFERFFRVLGNYAPGSGLGLAIVEQIAKLHNASIHLTQPETEMGLKVELRFPKNKS